MPQRWYVDVQHCGFEDFATAQGVVVFRKRNGIVTPRRVLSYGSSFGAPMSDTPTVLSTSVFMESHEGRRFVYSIPPECLFRVSSPLSVVSANASGLSFRPHDRVPEYAVGSSRKTLHAEVRLPLFLSWQLGGKGRSIVHPCASARYESHSYCCTRGLL